jgi:putative drug exporter of the RND superfamily
VARWVQGRAVVVAVGVTVLLVGLATPFLGARFENGDARTLPRSSEVRAVALVLAERFPARGTDPVVVVADVDRTSAEFAAWLDEVTARPGVVGSSIRPGTSTDETVVDLVPAGTSQGSEATALVKALRADSAPFELQVGGQAAELLDVKDILSSRLPLAAAVIVLATLVLLFLMTGSIVVPVKAVIMNILSLGASFGALVWIFQDGNLSGLLAFDSVGALDLWMPVLILIFAFGLSMDYEVFLLSRIKEVHDETGDNDLSVAVGLQRSGKIITSAAILIVIVFLGFAAGEVLAIKQLGVGLAIAVVIDATLVRTLLVPATMHLLGEWNWWAPRPMRRFHERFGLHEPPSAGLPAVEPAVTA